MPAMSKGVINHDKEHVKQIMRYIQKENARHQLVVSVSGMQEILQRRGISLSWQEIDDLLLEDMKYVYTEHGIFIRQRV